MPQEEIYAQKENVFLHPRKFYKKFFPNLKIKRDPPDTVFIKTYPNYLSASMHLLSPSLGIDIRPTGQVNGVLKFRTNIADIAGFSASYRFISAGFAFLLKSGVRTHDNYAKSDYRTATIKYSRGAYLLHYKYLRFKGLTDINQSNDVDPRYRYGKRRDIVSKEFQFEGLYNHHWRTYSYIAPFTFSQRQIKSQAGFLFKAGIYYDQFLGDYALIDPHQHHYDNDLHDIRVIRSLSIRLAPGVGSNFVLFKKWYLSFAVFPSYDLYFYKLLNHPEEKVKGTQTFAFTFDGKTSLGYQSKRLYGGLNYELERRHAKLQHLTTNKVYSYIGVELGYRFTTPRLVKKVFKETMPPGME